VAYVFSAAVWLRQTAAESQTLHSLNAGGFSVMLMAEPGRNQLA
jgi:hypothetical protein